MEIEQKALAQFNKMAKNREADSFSLLQGFSVLREIRHRLRGLIVPAIFMALTYYFGWNAVHGKSGLEAQAAQRALLQAEQQNADKVHQQLVLWQTKVAALSNRSVEPDMLNEEAREVLNLADPNDLVVDLTKAQSGE